MGETATLQAPRSSIDLSTVQINGNDSNPRKRQRTEVENEQQRSPLSTKGDDAEGGEDETKRPKRACNECRQQKVRRLALIPPMSR
jgi:hypothetical protein